MRVLFFCLSLVSLSSFASVETYFNAIQNNPAALTVFLKAMPKGGELHYHLAGGAYPEAMLEGAKQGDYCIDPGSFAISLPSKTCKGIKAASMKMDLRLYESVLRAWSLKDFIAASESSHDHFFNTFYKFGNYIRLNLLSLLMDSMARAAAQNALYLEVMVFEALPKHPLLAEPVSPLNFDSLRKKLLANPAFKKDVASTISTVQKLKPEAKQAFHCAQNQSQAVCSLEVRFQLYLLRASELPDFFTQALLAFEAASQSDDIVGVNSVQEEDNFVALRDYQKQMDILDYLHQLYPAVHIALHAGELSAEAVTPANLSFHITEAVKKGHAERIGHGVSIAYEKDAAALLNYLHKNQIAVEINLTSNQKILGVSGKHHPLHLYLANKVPVVLSTDDEGILRTDLTREYVKAATEHQLNYATLKQISRNALSYSFLPGKNLWAKVAEVKPVAACENLLDQSCLDFVKNQPKALLQRNLELRFRAFEKPFE